LIEVAAEMESIKEAADGLGGVLKAYSVRLESLREKIEGAARLHHLLALKLNDDDIQKEMQRLADKIGLAGLMQSAKQRKATGKMTITTTTITTSTPKKEREMTCDSQGDSLLISSSMLPAIEESPEKRLENAKACRVDDDVDVASKLADSGVETFVESFEMKDDDKLLRACSCQSIADDAMLACDNSQHDDHVDADLDDYDTSENITSISLDEPNKSESLSTLAPVPLQANAHLYCHASNLQLDLDDTSIDQKTQKYEIIPG
jgi:pleckstrin homology domain-containing family G member 4